VDAPHGGAEGGDGAPVVDARFLDALATRLEPAEVAADAARWARAASLATGGGGGAGGGGSKKKSASTVGGGGGSRVRGKPV